MSIVTLAQAKAQINIDPDDTDNDIELQGYVDAITGVVENYKHEVIEPRACTDEVDLAAYRWRPFAGGRHRRFRLYQTPIMSITSAVSADGETTFDTSAWRADPISGLVTAYGSTWPYGCVLVTYQAGYETVPPRYVQGALVILQHVWETQRGIDGSVAGVTGDDEKNRMYFYSIPKKALEWLGGQEPLVV